MPVVQLVAHRPRAVERQVSAWAWAELGVATGGAALVWAAAWRVRRDMKELRELVEMLRAIKRGEMP